MNVVHIAFFVLLVISICGLSFIVGWKIGDWIVIREAKKIIRERSKKREDK